MKNSTKNYGKYIISTNTQVRHLGISFYWFRKSAWELTIGFMFYAICIEHFPSKEQAEQGF